MAAHQAPPSLGFSRQEHWSGCHFLLQCMNVNSEREVAQSCPTLCDPMDCSLPGSSIHGIFQARVLEWVAFAFSASPTYITPIIFLLFRSFVLSFSATCLHMFFTFCLSYIHCPYLKVILKSCSVMSDSLRHHGLYSPGDSPGQNTGVGSLSLLQGIFPTRGLNPSLPHCRQILYQLSHKGSPRILEWVAYPFSSGNTQDRIIAILSGSRKTDLKFGSYVFLSQMILNLIFGLHYVRYLSLIFDQSLLLPTEYISVFARTL